MLKLLMALVFLVLLCAPGLSWWVAQRPVPLLEGFGELRGLAGPVLVRYDSRAIPYIKAESNDDVYAAQGYVTARERMFQMDMLRRAAEGRFAQVFGITALASDRLMRSIGFERLAEEELKALTPQASAALQSYTRGVNSYLEENQDRLPLEFTLLGYKPAGWRGVDSLAIMKYLAYELDESWKLDELRWRVTNKVGDNMANRLFNDELSVSVWSPEPSHHNSASEKSLEAPAAKASLIRKLSALTEEPEFFRKPERTWGSTCWVLSPNHTKTGGAMLAADKHSALRAPCDYFLCSLVSNNLRVAGASIPGVPGIIFGRNSLISWSGASMKADVQDLFVEHFASETDNNYKTVDKVETASEFREAIPVRWGNDIDHKITVTKHGPLLLRDKESGIALSWTGSESSHPWLNSLCALNTSSNWSEFSAALSTYGGPPQLFVYADKSGNIGCHAAGLIPLRAGAGQGSSMSEGWLAKGQWTGTVKFEDMPQSFIQRGSSGRSAADFCIGAGQKLSSANVKPAQFWGKQWSPPYRANRLALSLPRNKQAQKLDLFDFTAYQGDELSMTAALAVKELGKAMEADKSIDRVQAEALKLMRRWDFCIKRDSAAASCYESFMGTLARRLLEPQLGRELTNDYFKNWPLWITFVEDYLRHKPADLLKEDRTHETFLLTTFVKSNTRLKLLFKTDEVEKWVWGKAHLASFKTMGLYGLSWLRYLLDINGVGVGGDSNCLNACDVDRLSVSGPFNSGSGPVVRLLIDMSDDQIFYGNLAPGQSGHYFSAHRGDQLESWLHADPLPIAFSETQIDKQCRHKFYLSSPNQK